MSETIKPQFRTIDGVSIRFAESDRPGERRDAILLSPWPESVFAFDHVWSRFADKAHLIAVDPPGFGGSESRETLLSPKAIGTFILRLADEFGLENPHLVGPDIGTSSSLFAAAQQPDRFRSVVVGSGGAAVPLQLTGPLKEWVEATDLEPYRRLDSRKVVDAALSTIPGFTPSRSIRDDYYASYQGTRFAESMRYAQTYPAQLPELAELLQEIKAPVRIIMGSKDGVVPPVNAQFLDERLANSRVDFMDTGHFCWEEKPDEYASLVLDWWETSEPRR